MSEPLPWQTVNEQYLRAALVWLRLRLDRLTLAGGSIPVERLAEEIEQAAREMAAIATTDPPPALVLLSQRLGLTAFEQSILLLCVAIELDVSMAERCAQAQGQQRPYPTFALALSCFDEPAWEALSPERPLRYWRLLDITQPAAQPLITSALRADERIVNYARGLNHLDDRLRSLLVSLETVRFQGTLPPSQQAQVDAIAHTLQTASPWAPLPLIQLVGADNLSQQLIAQTAANLLGLNLYRLPVDLLPNQPGELETFARLWQRESLLLPIALYLDAHDCETTSTSQATPLNRFFNHSSGLFFLSNREARQNLGPSVHTFDIEKPTPAEQKILWSTALNDLPSDLPTQLAAQFNLSAVTIDAIAHSPTHPSSFILHPSSLLLPPSLWQTCLLHTRPQLDTLAQRISPKATWEDLVLPPEETNLLHQIAAQVRQRSTVYLDWGFQQRMNRGMGISALFAGESGTGKTMAAEVIANDLCLNLYRIDLSGMVSKYIGETEKNLRRLFDAAEDGGVILFFDEADALFGKRSEVKDSHDRYANIEINYLLQRMEAYRGLAILATNLKTALDPAFLRRLRFVVTFPFPSIKERLRLWQNAFPPQTPLEGLDYDRLAHLNLTGGNIHTVAINAAFLAATAGTPITMAHVLAAARTEYRKLDRPINEADFGIV